MTVTLNQDGAGTMRQRMQVNGHTMYADIGPEYGGDASAPEPHDLFDAALAACKAQTLQIYARRKGWPLDGVDITVQRDDSEERQGRYKVDVAITLHGELSDEQRAQLFAISERCPVHKLMTTAEIAISTHPAHPV